MDLVTLCPFVASKVVWQANSGAFALTVIVKATFVLQPGTAQLAPEQDPILEHDRYYDDDPRRGVRAPSDVVPYKPRADVLLVGHAYAPGKQPVRSLVTRFVVGDMDKSIEVWCDRAFRVIDGQLLEGKRFTEMPLVWERAAGGPESANPIGKRFDGAMDAYGTIAIANQQPPGHFVSKRSDTFVPTCYAPVAPTWPGRTQRLGRLSRSILNGAWNAQTLPPDLDPSFFQAAPDDQKVAEIRANERIVLENLHPDHVRLVTSLPGRAPRAIADRATGEREEITLIADTLWIDTDRGVCCVVWRGRIGLRHPQEAGRIAIWVDGMPMVEAASGAESAGDAVDAEPDAASTMICFTPTGTGPALPFLPGYASLAPSEPLGRYAPTAQEENDSTGTMFVSLDKIGVKPIPFEREENAHSRFDQTMAPQAISTVATPFVVPTSPEPPSFVARPYANERMGWAEATDSPELPPPIEFTSTKNEDVAPPAMIGPLAKVEMPSEIAPKSDEVKTRKCAIEVDVVAENEDDGDIVELSVELTAAIAAELAEGHIERAKVLEAHELTERAWTKNEERWESAIEEEDAYGKNDLAARYDAAYVKRVEGIRGVITADDYAKLVVGMERGREAAVLKELRIQEESLMPVMRIWATKMAGDVGVARDVAGLVRSGRGA